MFEHFIYQAVKVLSRLLQLIFYRWLDTNDYFIVSSIIEYADFLEVECHPSLSDYRRLIAVSIGACNLDFFDSHGKKLLVNQNFQCYNNY